MVVHHRISGELYSFDTVVLAVRAFKISEIFILIHLTDVRIKRC